MDGVIRVIILGIDPGTAITGYGVVDYQGNHYKLIEYGVIRSSKDQETASRLNTVHKGIIQLIETHKPDYAAVEELFFNKNVKTALTVGQARGVIMLGAYQKGISIYEYTPLQVKQAVVGYGRAEKNQVQFMVKAILNLPDIPRPDDAADALAIAICHGHSCSSCFVR
jgi:crossover junction endodeoxyribonuclease RuvC